MNCKPKIELAQQHLTGIPGIDVQQKELFAKINSFLGSFKGGSPSPDSVIITIQSVLGNLKSLFSIEETLMETVYFPKIREHKALHKNFLNMFAEELKNLKGSGSASSANFLPAFQASLLTHITIFDRDYVVFIEKLLTTRMKFENSAQRAQAIA